MKQEVSIVIVDDNADIRYTVAEICKSQGWIPIACENHREVMRMLNAGSADLFLVDYHLPEVDGVGVVSMIRKRLPAVPIVVLTVEEKDSVLQRFLEAGANDYALKPIKALDLISRLKVHLQYQEQNQFYRNNTKGISEATLQSLYTYLQDLEDFVDIDQITSAAEITQKSIYRYLKYMQDNQMLDVQYHYGEKAGRPKASYRLRRSTE